MRNIAPHYVYEWVRPDYNEVYYVGKGSKRRAWQMVRDNDWTNYVTNKILNSGQKPRIQIAAWFVNEDSAYEFEMERIAFLKPLGFLTNDHPGGKAPPRMVGADHPMYGKPGKSGNDNVMAIPEVREKQFKNIPRGDLHSMKRPEVKAAHKASQNRPETRAKRIGDNNVMKNPEVKIHHLEIIQNDHTRKKQKANTPRGKSHYMSDPERKTESTKKGWETRRKNAAAKALAKQEQIYV